jgi:lipoprotein-anchoring transpeptidase ErfK/SrfK
MSRPNAVLLRTALACLLAAGCATVAQAKAPAAAVAPPEPVPTEADHGAPLKPGEFRWLSAQERNGMPVVVMVDLEKQRGLVYRGGELVAITTVSTGKTGHGTPTGVYPILQKKKVHHSNKYEDDRGRPAAMPFMQRLTWEGVALHAGRVRDRPASHGCVRLPREFAEQLFGLTKHGDIVVISKDASLQSLAQAGLEMQLAFMLGASSPIREIAGAVAIDRPAPDERAGELATAAAGGTAF